MATVHFDEHVIELNVAYFGPLQAGCGSNVRHLHRTAPARERSELRRVGAKDRKERMWWFSYQPNDPPTVTGFEIRVRVVSVPSAAELELDRDAMLTGVDGIVLVCDARGSRTEANVAALQDLEQLLVRQGIELGSLPMIFQVNQADAQNARPFERVVEDLNPFGFPVFEATARTGRGVIETHDAIVAAITSRLRDNLHGAEASVTLTALTRAQLERAEDAIVSHAAALPQAARQMPAALGLPASAEIPVRLTELRGSSPIQHVRTEVRGARLRVTATFRREDGTHRKLAFLIEPGEPPGEAPGGRRTATELAASRVPTREAFVPSREVPGDLPGLGYGIAGVVGGLTAGVLLGYIWFG